MGVIRIKCPLQRLAHWLGLIVRSTMYGCDKNQVPTTTTRSLVGSNSEVYHVWV